ncbi:diacylglycerol/lipid kinase family protein [Gryllotalpicola ginsengisoli]|uniref:diacylglycerol/lipid kinase family protein n=1 Tax=Gryllotalpicola ginsengisoli TaxID=444608 RepID=UPI0003B306F1|nr:diacylglycerol kinase family protein [Gryllotalpicola ginsengisoli]
MSDGRQTDPSERAHRRAAVICNPTKVDLPRLRAAVEKSTADAGWEPAAWFETTPDDPGHSAVRSALAGGASVLIVAGGDGTVRAVVEELGGRPVPVAVVPAGTGNLLARNLGLPMNDLQASVRAAFSERERRIDVATAELTRPDGSTSSHAFVVMAGIGLDARMAAETSAALKSRMGWVAYADPISRSIMSGHRFSFHYAVDGAPPRGVRAHTVIVGNCGTLTANVLLIPDARPDDGILDAVVLRPQGVKGWAQVGVRLVFARFLHRTATGMRLRRALRSPRALRFARARRIDVRLTEPQLVELDGDDMGAIAAASIRVLPRALVLRVPILRR